MCAGGPGKDMLFKGVIRNSSNAKQNQGPSKGTGKRGLELGKGGRKSVVKGPLQFLFPISIFCFEFTVAIFIFRPAGTFLQGEDPGTGEEDKGEVEDKGDKQCSPRNRGRKTPIFTCGGGSLPAGGIHGG